MPSKSTRRVRSNALKSFPRHGGRRGPVDPPSLALLDRRILELLEARVLLSVSTDVNGYTVVTPSANSEVIYVSSSSGKDTNNGLSPASAVQTVAQARALLGTRNNMPDQILLQRGDVFPATIINNWTVSGASPTQPFVLGAFTNPAHPSTQRPLVESGDSSGFTNAQRTSSHPSISYLDILGISFEPDARNYRQPSANFTIGFHDDAVGGTYGVNLLGSVHNVLIEDCSFQYYRMGIVVQSYAPFGDASDPLGRPSNIELRRNVIADNYAESFSSVGYVTSEGCYFEGTDGITLDGNVFDHNGWTDPAYGNLGCYPTIYNHDAYIQIDNTNLVATGNIFAEASSHGLQARCGGIVTNNIFIDDPIAMSFGYANNEETPGGVFGQITGNVIYGSATINGANRGWGLEIGNLKPKSAGGGTLVADNIYSSYAAQGQPAIQISFGINHNNPATAVGVNDLTVQDNTVYGWTQGVYINPGFNPGTTAGRYSFSNVNILNNEFQQVFATPIVIDAMPYNSSVQTWRGNRYEIQGTATSTTPYFQLQGVNKTLAQWQQLVEPTASTPLIAYPNPNNSPATYDSTKGGPGTVADFLTQARQLSSTFYRAQYTAGPVVNYIQAGFSGQRIDTQPPSGALAASPVNVAGGATATFTVTWTDDNQVNFSSIGNGDLQVTGPNGFSQNATLLTASANASGSTVTAVYSIPAAGGAWSFAANGTYTVSVLPNAVIDTSGNAAAAGSIGTFKVNISPPAPTASLAVTNVTLSTASATLTVTYTASGSLIDSTTLDSNDLVVTGPNGFKTTATYQSQSPGGNAASVVGTYTIDPPASGWPESANGLYTVTVQSGQIDTTVGTPIGTSILGTFTVNVSVPSASATGPTITNSTASADEIVTVTYEAAAGINASTVSATNLQISGPGYYADGNSGVTLLSVSGTGTPSNPLIAKYDIPANGGWTDSEDGTFTVALVDGQVKDTLGNQANGGVIGSFNVNVDFTGPAAVTTAPNIYLPTPAATIPITVVFTDPSGVNTSTIGNSSISVQAPDGSTPSVTLQGITGSGTAVTATYLMSTTNLMGDATTGISVANNGTYSVNVNPGLVADNLGNLNTGTFAGSFDVNIGTAPPTGSAFANDVTDPAQSVLIYADYSGNPPVDPNTITGSNVIVTGPNGYSQPVTLLSVDEPAGADASVVYQLNPPAGGWQANLNGVYSIVLQPKQVADLSGDVMPTQTLGTFNVNISNVPTGTILPVTPNPASPGLNQLTIQFSQKMSGVTLSQMTLSLNGGPNLLTSAQTLTTTDGGITYVLGNLQGLTTQSGQYTLNVSSTGTIVGTVGTPGAPLAQDITTLFGVDATPPTVTASAGDITTAGTQLATFTVTYSDDNLVSFATIGNGNVLVTGPNGYSQVGTLVSIDNNTDSSVLNVTYSVPAPTNGWSVPTDGVYSIKMVANQVSDVNANFIPAQLLTAFNVNINNTQPPSVAGSASDITTSTGQAETFTITYTSSSSSVRASTIATGNIVVIGPTGASQIATLVSVDNSSDSPVINATYSIPAPSGLWTSAYNGAYAINIRANQVSDVNGNFIPVQFITSFNVNVTADTTPPAVSGSAGNITTLNSLPETFTVTYTDGTAVNAATLATGNVIVTGPGGYSQIATLVSVDSTANGPVRTATYSVPPPTTAGRWDAYANGTYTISTRANQVDDVSGNFVPAAAVTTFTVNVPDAQGPVPTGSAPDITTAGTQAETFTITYTDATAVKASTIASGNILVTGPGGSTYSQVATLVSVDSTANGPVRTAKYSVPAPTGGWNAAANGTYAVRMRSTQVSDTLGNYAFTQFITAFNVNTPPAIASVTPNPVTASASAQNLTINGSNFAPTATVNLHNLTAGTVTNATIVSRSSNQIVVSNTFGTSASSWSAEVLNGTISSGQTNFSVAAGLTIGVTPNPVTGKTAALTVTNGGTSTSTIFKWAATTIPSGATTPTFSANGTNAAQKSTITFFAAGSYTLTLTSTTGTTVKTATATFNVNQALTSVTLSPASVTLTETKTQQFTAAAKDQFGAAMATQPAFSWSLASGGVGSLSTKGLYTAPTTGTGSATVKATAGSISGSATVTVTPIQINFEPSTATSVSGYLVDSGSTYAARNGLTYGWTVSETSNAVQRNKNSNHLLDTNIGILSGAAWELSTANGTYSVTFSVGDSSTATTNTVRLEGTTILNAVKLAANAFTTKTATVTVSNGILKLDAGSAASLLTRVDYIQVTRLS